MQFASRLETHEGLSRSHIHESATNQSAFTIHPRNQSSARMFFVTQNSTSYISEETPIHVFCFVWDKKLTGAFRTATCQDVLHFVDRIKGHDVVGGFFRCFWLHCAVILTDGIDKIVLKFRSEISQYLQRESTVGQLPNQNLSPSLSVSRKTLLPTSIFSHHKGGQIRNRGRWPRTIRLVQLCHTVVAAPRNIFSTIQIFTGSKCQGHKNTCRFFASAVGA